MGVHQLNGSLHLFLIGVNADGGGQPGHALPRLGHGDLLLPLQGWQAQGPELVLTFLYSLGSTVDIVVLAQAERRWQTEAVSRRAIPGEQEVDAA